MIVRVTLERIGSGARGDRYRVTHAGLVLVESSRDPAHDACRALLALGLTGTLETRHASSPIVSIRMDIERGARRTVIETERCGPRFRRWRPFSERTQRIGMPIAESASRQGREF